MLPNQKATLQLIYTNEFGDKTDVTKTLGYLTTVEELYWSIRSMLMAIGFSEVSVEDWFPSEV